MAILKVAVLILRCFILLQEAVGSVDRRLDALETDVTEIKTLLKGITKEVANLSSGSKKVKEGHHQKFSRVAPVANLKIDDDAEASFWEVPGRVSKKGDGKCLFKGQGLELEVHVRVEDHEMLNHASGFLKGVEDSAVFFKTEYAAGYMSLQWKLSYEEGGVPAIEESMGSCLAILSFRWTCSKDGFIASNPPEGFTKGILWVGEFYSKHQGDIESVLKALSLRETTREEVWAEVRRKMEEEEREKVKKLMNIHHKFNVVEEGRASGEAVSRSFTISRTVRLSFNVGLVPTGAIAVGLLLELKSGELLSYVTWCRHNDINFGR
ncbi:hypothetical protein FOL47_000344 [Perkinsus chesapeaki]|uniref:Uncharacterized protein n=1 Tax=Perkinsus chesapeaki TaxID=330153 RepID=A0A7J6MLY3_PERCH|nr:hypothetical protein FOL47_000344 [Perkinsus chesapeaki]